MRATDGLQTTITVSPVKDNGQALSLELSLVEIRGHQSSSGDTIPNCLGEFREIRESKQRTGIENRSGQAPPIGADRGNEAPKATWRVKSRPRKRN